MSPVIFILVTVFLVFFFRAIKKAQIQNSEKQESGPPPVTFTGILNDLNNPDEPSQPDLTPREENGKFGFVD